MRKNRNIRVRGIRRAEPDLRKLGRALLALVEAQREAEAQAAHHKVDEAAKPTPSREPFDRAEQEGGGSS